MIAIDTSSFSRYLAGIVDRTTTVVDRVLTERVGVLPAVVVTELLSKPLDPEIRATVLDLPLLPLLPDYWQRAGDLRASLLRLGRKARLADCLIAQSCIDNDAPLITYDRDFRHFENAGLKLL